MTKRVKVLHIIPSFACGGAERMTMLLMQNLDYNQFEVAAISMFNRVGSEIEKMMENKGIRVWYLGKRKGFDTRMYKRINDVFNQFRPQIVHTHLSVLRYVLPLLLWHRIIGKVHTVHNMAEMEVDTPGKLVHKLAFRMGVIPVAIANEVASSMKRVYGIDNVRLIPVGIPIHNFSVPMTERKEWRKQAGIGEKETVIVSIGRLTKQKNQQLLIESFARFLKIQKSGHLMLVGDGDKRHELEVQVERLKLGQEVHFLGLRNDITDILHASDIFVLSSDWEGNPQVVMEAMAAGKPVVSTAVGGVPELLTDKVSGILVRPGDVTALAESLVLLINDEGKRKEMGQAALERAKKYFCIEVMTKHYEKLYEDLISKS